MQRFWLFLLTFMLVFNMSVVAYADETTSLAEAPAESAAVAEVTESEIAPISVETEVDQVDGPVIKPVDLDEVYVDLVFTGIKGNLASIVSQSTFDVILTDVNGQVAKASVDVSSAVDDRLKVKVDTKNLDTTKTIQFSCSSGDFAVSDICKVLEVVSVNDVVMGSEANPTTAVLEFVKEQFISIRTKDVNGNVIPNVSLSFEDEKGLKTEVVTDGNGLAKLSATKYAGMSMKVKSLNNKYSIPLNTIIATDSTEIDIVVEVDESKVDETSLILNVKTDVLTDISSNWAEFTLELSDTKGQKHSIVNKTIGVSSHKLPKGSYSVSVVNSPYCTVKVGSSISISNNNTLNVSVYPLSTFEIYDGGREYDFEILGVSHLEGRHYTGTEKKVFGVMPGTVVQLKSDNVDKAYTVSSENTQEKVTVELSKGTTSATPVGAPKTFDIIDALLILAVLLLLGLISGGVYLYKSGALKSKNVTAMLLVFAMLCTMMPANISTDVYGYTQGMAISAGNASTVSTGFRIMYDLPVVLKFTLYPTMPAGYPDAPKATADGSPFTEEGRAQPTLDEYSPVSSLSNPLAKTSKYDFASLYLVLDSNKKSAALPANHAMSWINGGILRYTEDADGNMAKVVLGYPSNGYDNDYYCNWEKQLRTVFAHKPDSITQQFPNDYTTTFLKAFGESLDTSGLYQKSPSTDFAGALNRYMASNILLERDSDWLSGNRESSGFLARKANMKLLTDSWVGRVDAIYSNTSDVSSKDEATYQYWKKSIEEGYASIIVEPYACIYDNGGGGQGKRPQFLNMNQAEVDGLYPKVGDPNWVIRSAGDSSQWRRFSGLFHPNTVTSGGQHLGSSQNGWGLYSIFGFADWTDVRPTTPVIAVTYNERITWKDTALAEAIWNGSWTDLNGEKKEFKATTESGESLNAENLLRGLDLKLEAFDNGTLSEEEAKIVGGDYTALLEARTTLERVKNVAPHLALTDFKDDVLKLIEFADDYCSLNVLYSPPAGYNSSEHTKVSDLLKLSLDAGVEIKDADYNDINFMATSGSDFYLMYHDWLGDTTLPDEIRNDGATLPTKLAYTLLDRIYPVYAETYGDPDGEVYREMYAFAYEMGIHSAFYNAAAITLSEKNRPMNSGIFSQFIRIGEAMDEGEDGQLIINNEENSNDLGNFIKGNYELELSGDASLDYDAVNYPTTLTFAPNTQFYISLRMWDEGKTPQTILDNADIGGLRMKSTYYSELTEEQKRGAVYEDLLLSYGTGAKVNVISSLMTAVKESGDNLSYYDTPNEKLSAIASDVANYITSSGGNSGAFNEVLQTHIDNVGPKGIISGRTALDSQAPDSRGDSLISENLTVEKLFALTALGEGVNAGYNFFINKLVEHGVDVPNDNKLRENASLGVSSPEHKELAFMYIYSLLNEYINGLTYINTSASGSDYLDYMDDRYIQSPMFTARQFGVEQEGDPLNINIENLRLYWPEVDKALTILSSTHDVGNPYSSYYVADERIRDSKRGIAQFVINIQGTDSGLMTVTTPPPEPVSGLEFVPQWRINKSYNDLSVFLNPGDSIQPLTWYLSGLKWGNKHSMSPSKVDLYLDAKMTENSYDAYIYPKESKNKRGSISYSSNTHIESANSPITMYKTSDVDNINTASWVSDTLKFKKHGFEFVTSESKNIHDVTDAVVSDSFKLTYSYITDDSITHGYRRGRRGHRYWNYENPIPRTDKNSTTYDISGNFLCYNAENTTSKPGAGITHSEDGYSEFTAVQGNLNVLPEVPMLYTDVNGNNSVHFTTGDKLRALKPLSYHTFEYDFGTIEPSIVGSSVATDQKSITLAGSLGLGNQGQVIHKGAGTTSSYEVDGVIRTKTYAIDIDDSSLKGTWNSGSTYSASAINKSFLESFATANATGGYTANIDAVENLMVDGNKLGDVYQSVTVTANGTSSERYELTVRAGVVTAVNGKKNWKTVYPELVPVIEEKLGLTPDKVFAAFASGKGDNLNERAFETLSKALRENSSSIEEGKGWYSEDTTVLSLYVYTTEFEVPDMLFANKIPQEISAVSELATPRNKDNFYKVGRLGHLNLDLCLKGKDGAGNVINIKLNYNTANAYPTGKGYANAKKLYVIPNVSILDTTLNQ